jgi:hypothetical protein
LDETISQITDDPFEPIPFYEAPLTPAAPVAAEWTDERLFAHNKTLDPLDELAACVAMNESAWAA